jgi:hypothetical protein
MVKPSTRGSTRVPPSALVRVGSRAWLLHWLLPVPAMGRSAFGVITTMGCGDACGTLTMWAADHVLTQFEICLSSAVAAVVRATFVSAARSRKVR